MNMTNEHSLAPTTLVHHPASEQPKGDNAVATTSDKESVRRLAKRAQDARNEALAELGKKGEPMREQKRQASKTWERGDEVEVIAFANLENFRGRRGRIHRFDTLNYIHVRFDTPLWKTRKHVPFKENELRLVRKDPVNIDKQRLRDERAAKQQPAQQAESQPGVKHIEPTTDQNNS
jgi:hypothetical protein